jgi:hypothetical protein
MSVRPVVAMKEMLKNLLMGTFTKICMYVPTLLKIGQT